MSKQSFILVFLTLLVNTSLLFSQNQSEHVKLLDGSIVYGRVELSKKNPNQINFKGEGQKKIFNYSAGQILSFWDDYHSYQSKVVRKREAPIFLEVLVEGEVSLYQLEKDFYIQKEEIFYKLSKNDIEVEGGIQQDKKYIGFAKFLLSDCLKKSNTEWDRLKFAQASMVELVTAYNNCKYPNNSIQNYTLNKSKLNRGVYLEGMMTRMYDGRSGKKAKPSFAVGGFIEIYSKNFTKMKLGMQFSLKQGEVKNSYRPNSALTSYSLGIVEVPVLLQKRIVRTGLNNGIFINTGLVLGVSVFKNLSNDDPISTFALDSPALIGFRAGIGYTHRFNGIDLAINYFFERDNFGKGLNIQSHGIRISRTL